VKSKIEIECAVIEKLENGIIQISYKSNYRVELEDVKEVEKVYVGFSNGEAIYSLLISNGGFSQFSNEAQKFLAEEASIVSRIKGSAVVLNNLPFRILTRFFIKFYKPKFPTKIFSEYSDAVQWLTELKEE
jgi:hypothetical protein